MPNKYPFKPRGIIKWQAFSAVVGVEEQFEAATTKEELEIDLLDDRLELLDKTLLEAYQNNFMIRVSYLEDNQVKTYDSKIINMNAHEKTIYLHHKKLSIDSIIDIEIL